MEKKRYMVPDMKCWEMENELPVCVSPGVSGNGMGYGGVDSEGTKDPSVKQRMVEAMEAGEGEELW